jgi:hypothetical protein
MARRILFTGLAILAAFVAIVSLPDLKRYLKIRAM